MRKMEVISELYGMIKKIDDYTAFKGQANKIKSIENGIDFLKKHKTGNRIESFIRMQAQNVFNEAKAAAAEQERILEEARLRHERLNNDR